MITAATKNFGPSHQFVGQWTSNFATNLKKKITIVKTKISDRHSGDLNNKLVWYSGHKLFLDHRMVSYSNGVLNTGQNCLQFRSWLE